MSDEHLTERQLAEELQISVRTLQARRQRGGGIPYEKIGRSVRYSRAKVMEYLAGQERRSTKERGG